MTKEDIIKLAHKAGFLIDTHAQQYQPNCILSTHGLIDENLQRFATLVAAQGAAMTDLRQAAQQALECIERLNMRGFILADFETEVYAAITSLKAALEQPEQRKPMTANTILNMMPSSIPAEYDGALMEFARAIEQAHNIKEGT